MKNGGLTKKNGDLTIKNGDLTMKNGGFTKKNMMITISEMWFQQGTCWFKGWFNQQKTIRWFWYILGLLMDKNLDSQIQSALAPEDSPIRGFNQLKWGYVMHPPKKGKGWIYSNQPFFCQFFFWNGLLYCIGLFQKWFDYCFPCWLWLLFIRDVYVKPHKPKITVKQSIFRMFP